MGRRHKVWRYPGILQRQLWSIAPLVLQWQSYLYYPRCITLFPQEAAILNILVEMFQPVIPYWPNSYTDVQSYDENGTNYITQLQHTKDESWKAAHKTMINILLFTKVNLSQKLLPNASPKNNTNWASLAVISSHNWTSNAIFF